MEKKPTKNVKRKATREQKLAAYARARKQNAQLRMSQVIDDIYGDARREVQARALWRMHALGELVLQTIEIPTKSGTMRKDILNSHHSRYAV